MIAIRLARTGDRRLAQPIVTMEGSILTLNGEVYNYKELADRLGMKCSSGLSDAAVAAMWLQRNGRSGLEHLQGEFALAFWDNRRQGLLLARDAFGSHPLFISRSGEGIAFASSARAAAVLVNGSFETSEQAISDFIWYGISAAGSAIDGVSSLRADSYIWRERCKESSGDFRSWYASRNSHVPIGEAIRLAVLSRVHGISAALSLSGGLDSSLIARQWPEDESCYPLTLGIDKAPVGSNSNPVHLTSSSLSSALRVVVAKAERPLTSLSSPAFSLLANQARMAGREVLLGGDGADEIFAGYHHYSFEERGHPFLVRKHDQRRALECWLELEPGLDPSESLLELLEEPNPASWIEFDRMVRLPEHLMPMNSDIPSLLNSIESRSPYLDLLSHSVNGENVRHARKGDLKAIADKLGIQCEPKKGVFVSSTLLGTRWFEDAIEELISSTTVAPGIELRNLRSIRSALAQIRFDTIGPLGEAILRLILSLWSIAHIRSAVPTISLPDILPHTEVNHHKSALSLASKRTNMCAIYGGSELIRAEP